MVDRGRHLPEESLELARIGGVERGDLIRVDFVARASQPFAIAAREHNVSACEAGLSGCFEADAGTPADDNDLSPEQGWFPVGGECLGHDFSRPS